jgi:hypothetical protein
MGVDAAVEIAAEFPLDLGWYRVIVSGPIAGQREPSLEVVLNRTVEQRALGSPPAVSPLFARVRTGIRVSIS